MTETASGPELVYQTQPETYDRLIRAEDADLNLERYVLGSLHVQGAVIADIGAGTGRLSRWVAPYAERIHLSDVAAPMLEVARQTLTKQGFADKVTIAQADARALPLEDASVDIAMAGWVYGHFRYWMPEGWEAVVDAAILEMERVTRAGGAMVIVETLGTGVESPQESPLGVFYERLESHHGFSRHWVRTDYAFDTVEDAVSVMEEFFGAPLADKIRRHAWTKVPECTAVFRKDRA